MQLGATSLVFSWVSCVFYPSGLRVLVAVFGAIRCDLAGADIWLRPTRAIQSVVEHCIGFSIAKHPARQLAISPPYMWGVVDDFSIQVFAAPKV
jgi:hypothetical protein